MPRGKRSSVAPSANGRFKGLIRTSLVTFLSLEGILIGPVPISPTGTKDSTPDVASDPPEDHAAEDSNDAPPTARGRATKRGSVKPAPGMEYGEQL